MESSMKFYHVVVRPPGLKDYVRLIFKANKSIDLPEFLAKHKYVAGHYFEEDMIIWHNVPIYEIDYGN